MASKLCHIIHTNYARNKLLQQATPLYSQLRYRITSARSKRLAKLGISAEGKPLPIPNKNRIFQRLYPCMVVNQDGSTYTIQTIYPYHIITLPSESNVDEMSKSKKKRKTPIIEEKEEEGETWSHSQYKDFIR